MSTQPVSSATEPQASSSTQTDNPKASPSAFHDTEPATLFRTKGTPDGPNSPHKPLIQNRPPYGEPTKPIAQNREPLDTNLSPDSLAKAATDPTPPAQDQADEPNQPYLPEIETLPSVEQIKRQIATSAEERIAFAALDPSEFDRATAAFDPSWDTREGHALRLLRDALPNDRKPELQNLALRGLLGQLPPTGGIAGRVRQVVLALAGSFGAARTLAVELDLALSGTRDPALPTVLSGLAGLGPVQATEEKAIRMTEVSGLVLLAPFIPTLFEMTCHIENQQFADDAARIGAASLLTYVALGDGAIGQEAGVLERLLTGLPLDGALPPVEMPKDEAAAVVQNLLETVCQRWPPLANSSPNGLREAFLVRPGILSIDNKPVLEVEGKTIDILLQQLPWTYSHLSLPWLEEPLDVMWRGNS